MVVKASDAVTLASITDVQYMRRYYLVQQSTLPTPASPTTNPPPVAWGTTEPSYTAGATTSLYTIDLVVFSDETFDYLPVQLSSSYEAAKQAYNKAQAAADAANSAQNTANAAATAVGNAQAVADSKGRVYNQTIAPNPVLRTNCAINPTFRATTGTKVVRTNLFPYPSCNVAGNTTNWGLWAGTGGAVTGSQQPGTDTPRGVAGYFRGTWTTAPTTGGGIALGIQTNISASTTYTFSMYVRPSITLPISIQGQWYDTSGTPTGAIAGAPVITCPAGKWTRLYITATSGASDGRYQLRAYVAGAGVQVGTTIDADDVLVEQTSVLMPYFDGSAAPQNLCPAPTSAASNNGVNYPAVPDPTVGRMYGGSTRCTPAPGYLSAAILSTYSTGGTGSGQVISVANGDAYAFSAWVMVQSTDATSANVKISWKNSAGTVTTVSGPTVTIPAGYTGWTQLSVYFPGDPTAVSLYTTAVVNRAHGTAIANVDVAWITDCQLETNTTTTSVLLPYLTPGWSGSVNSSSSTLSGADVGNYYPTVAYNASPVIGWASTQNSYMVMTTKAMNPGTIFTYTASGLSQVPAVPGDLFSIRLQARIVPGTSPTSISMVNRLYGYAAGTVTPAVADGTSRVIPNTGDWVDFSDPCTSPAPLTTTTVRLILYANSVIPIGTVLEIRQVVVERVSAIGQEAGAFFDGATPNTEALSFAFTGATNITPSTVSRTTDLWVDTTGGGNTPKMWNGSSWVVVTDKVASDAAAAAAAAQSTANSAASAASTAQTTANGKNQILWNTGAADTATGGAAGTKAGDIYNQYAIRTTAYITALHPTWTSTQIAAAADNKMAILASWQSDGNTWKASALSETYLPQVDIGAGTYGQLDGIRLIAKTVVANNILVPGTVDTTVIADGAITTTKITVNTLNGDRIAANTMNADKIIAGTITATQIMGGTITGDKLYANTITSGQINATDVAAAVGTFVKVQANNIQAGTVTSNLVLGATLTGGTTGGARVDIGNLGSGITGLRQYDANNNVIVDMTNGSATFTGAISGGSASFPAGAGVSGGGFYADQSNMQYGVDTTTNLCPNPAVASLTGVTAIGSGTNIAVGQAPSQNSWTNWDYGGPNMLSTALKVWNTTLASGTASVVMGAAQPSTQYTVSFYSAIGMVDGSTPGNQELDVLWANLKVTRADTAAVVAATPNGYGAIGGNLPGLWSPMAAGGLQGSSGLSNGAAKIGMGGWGYRWFFTFTTPSNLPANTNLLLNLPVATTKAGAATATLAAFYGAFQMEAKPGMTRYCDGNQASCLWNGTANASTSVRNGFSGLYTGAWTDPRVIGTLQTDYVKSSKVKLGSGSLHGTNFVQVWQPSAWTLTQGSGYHTLTFSATNISRVSNDDGAIWDGASTFTAPVTGLYAYSCTAVLSALPTYASSDACLIDLMTTGGATVNRAMYPRASGLNTQYLAISGLVWANAGDSFYFRVWENFAGSVTLSGNATGTPNLAYFGLIA